MTAHEIPPQSPQIRALVRADGTGEVVVDGTRRPLDGGGADEARAVALGLAVDAASVAHHPVAVTISEPEGLQLLLAHPDGTVTPGDTRPEPVTPAPQTPAPHTPAPHTPTPHTPGPASDDLRTPVLSPPGIPSPEPLAPEPLAPVASIPDGSASEGPVPAGSWAVGSVDVAQALRASALEGSRPRDRSRGFRALTALRPPAAEATAATPAGQPTAPAPSTTPAPTTAPAATVASARSTATASTTAPDPAPAATPVRLPAPTSTPAPIATAVPLTRRESFLTREQREEPATRGARGALSRLGLRVGPSSAEREERGDVHAVSQHWPGPRTIAVVNGKGGAGKTPTTVCLASVFARHGGAGVLAWDNNQTRGTLGWRTEQGPHEATLLDLLPQVDRLLGTGAQSADLARHVHHQTRDRFDVLRSKPLALADEQRVSPADVDAIHAVAAKYYRLVVMDSGNDESDPMWLRMIDRADQIVLATTTRDDHAEAGALLLEGLAERDARSAGLAARAVVVVGQADPRAGERDLERVAAGYAALARETVTVPHDPALVDGVIRYGSLRPATRRAWLRAGAAVARGL